MYNQQASFLCCYEGFKVIPQQTMWNPTINPFSSFDIHKNAHMWLKLVFILLNYVSLPFPSLSQLL